MIIDFHTHIFPDKIAHRTIEHLSQVGGIQPASDGTLEGLKNSMKETGVDLSVILPVVTKPEQFDNVNRFAKEINDIYKGNTLLSFGGIHPDCTDYKHKLRQIKEMGLKGIKIHPDYQGVMIDDKRFMNIIEYADALDLIIITHAGIDIGLPEPVHCPPDKMRTVYDKIKPKKMVLAHYGGWKQWEMVYDYLAGTEMYFDTAFTLDFIENEWFYKILDKHGAKRILFATDSPWSDAKKGIDYIRQLNIPEESKNMILYENAQKLLK